MGFFKRIAPLFLVVIILLKTFSLISTVLLFKINRQFYAEVLCINKNRPELACKGKCILMQKLQSQLQTEQKKESDKFPFIVERALESVFFSPSTHDASGKNFKTIRSTISTSLFLGYTLTLSKQVFHPPLA